jgi:hypothetical protein
MVGVGVRTGTGSTGAAAKATAVRCGAGGMTITASAEGRPQRMPARLRAGLPPAAAIIVDEPDRYVYRDGATGVVVERVDDQIRASATTTC